MGIVVAVLISALHGSHLFLGACYQMLTFFLWVLRLTVQKIKDLQPSLSKTLGLKLEQKCPHVGLKL